VIINRRAYEDIAIFAGRYANDTIDADNQRETYGILIGRVESDQKIVYVNQAIGILAGERTGVEFENKQYVDLSHIDESVWKSSVEYERGDFVCGWWHSHPGFGLFYSQTDIINHLGFQAANPYAIGIVFDYKLKKTALLDAGIDVFTLDDAKHGQMANYERVKFQIADLPHALDQLDHGLPETLKKIESNLKHIRYIENTLQKKQLAQLQRNYALLLLDRQPGKKKKDEQTDQDENEKYLFEWNEEDIKKRYQIPKFRQKIEKILQKTQNQKGGKYATQQKLIEELRKPHQIVTEIQGEFQNIVEKIGTVRRWLNAEERLTITLFQTRLNQYIKVINALLSKTFYLAPSDDLKKMGIFDESVLGKSYYGNEDGGWENEVPQEINPIIEQTEKIKPKQVSELSTIEKPPEIIPPTPSPPTQLGPPKIKLNPTQMIRIPSPASEEFPLLPVQTNSADFHIDLDELFEDEKKKSTKSSDDGWS
jgi:26S proteasome regulatory subunit N11